MFVSDPENGGGDPEKCGRKTENTDERECALIKGGAR